MNHIQALEAYKPVLHSGTANFLRLIAWQLMPKWVISSGLPGTVWRILLLRIFGAKIGKLCRLKPGLNISCPWNLKVGDFCWLGESVWIDSLATVKIGSRVCISQGTYLCTGNHDFKRPSFDLRLGSIVIEAESWVGAKSVLAPGSALGEGCVVCLGSVVIGDVQPRAIVRGNPAIRVATR